MPKFDTSFNFGANAPAAKGTSAKAGGKSKGARKKRRSGTTSSKSRKHFGAMHGS
jgi:hypothetical protein